MNKTMATSAAAVLLTLMVGGGYFGRAGPAAAAAPSPVSGCPAASYGPNSYAPPVPGGGKTVALTFDDGPGASTASILSILEAYGVPATFFNIGEQETEWPADVQAESEAGFLVGNHTWSHPDMVLLSAAGQAAELDDVTQEQEALTGTAPCVFRPPYGDYDATTLSLAQQRRMSVWLWSVDTEDWEAEGSSSAYWVNRIVSLAESEGGALDHPVVLMHNQEIPMPATVAALPIIIRFFEEEGYTFVNLLGGTGPQQGTVAAVDNADGEHVFWSADGELWNDWFTGGAWHGPAPVADATNLASPPAAVSTGGDNMDVFWDGTDGELWHAYYSDGSWNGPFSLGAPVGGAALDAVWNTNGSEHVFWAESDGNLWNEYFSQGRWRGPNVVTEGGDIAAQLRAVTTSATNLDVFWQGTNGALWHSYLVDGLWSGPYSLGGTMSSAPSPVLTSHGEDVFWVSSDGTLAHAYFTDGSWHAPSSLGIPVSGWSVAAVASPDSAEHVFWAGSDGSLQNAYFTDGAWHGPAPVTSGGAMGGPVSALSTGTAGIDVFWAGSDQQIWHSYYSPPWNGPASISSTS